MDAGLSATVVLPDTLPEITLFNPEVFECVLPGNSS